MPRCPQAQRRNFDRLQLLLEMPAVGSRREDLSTP
jgi:hypothetical protein